ncbi:berberine bridge enzyme-like 21 [Heracleum sosnowskyi]|uniref:Berberine bridge enzyme-like 21 n=1 Tax=Heracleum sosnowskyi TaxID=360622 RepID=A0AAD8MTP8_9APIA|nr:berberine bridge enzyme-like 21 [Heracleum sosnowskyi]
MASNYFMKLFSTLIVLSLPAAWAQISPSISNDFIQCLEKNSLPSNPISQAIYTPQNTSYVNVLDIYARNLRFMTPQTAKPLVIVAAMHESHVRAAILCSNQTNVLLRTRCGGHDYEALSYTANLPFVILDMFNFRSIDINLEDDTALVEGGVLLGELYYRIAEKSSTRAFPAGVCPTVGVSGHFSGGGYGTLIRKYGLSVDNIVDAKIMGLDGIVKDREAMGEDLFWAIRGGGGASFGVVLSWKLKLVEVPETVTVFTVNRTLEQAAADIIYKWQHVVTILPDDIFLRLELWPTDGFPKTLRATFIGLFLGNTEALLEIMNKQFPELGLTQNACTEMKWIESVLHWDAIPRGTPLEVLLERDWHGKNYLKSKSDFVKKVVSKQGLQQIFDKMMQVGGVIMQWNPYGGRMNNISESAVPLPQRAGYLFKIQYVSFWTQDGKKIADDHIQKSRQLYDFMAPYVTSSPREAFINYRDLDIGQNPYCNASYAQAKTYCVKYFKGNFERLVRIKTAVDPTNFFRNEQSIPTLPV